MLKGIGILALLFSSSVQVQVMWTAYGDNNPYVADNGMVVYRDGRPVTVSSIANFRPCGQLRRASCACW